MSYFKRIIFIFFCIVSYTAQSSNNLAPNSNIIRLKLDSLSKISSSDITPALFDEYVPLTGGKGYWNKILERYAGEIGYKVPKTEYVLINELWSMFLEDNKELVDELHNEFNPFKMYEFEFSDELIQFIENIENKFLEEWIVRSSGKYEDSYERSLAGVMISVRNKSKNDMVDAFQKVIEHTFKKIFLEQIDGVPNQLSKEEGLGFLVQEFQNFQASGTVMTDLYGFTSIETGFGDLDQILTMSDRNIVRFMITNNIFSQENKNFFDKENSERFHEKVKNSPYEYGRPFEKYPSRFVLNGKSYSLNENPMEMKALFKYKDEKGPGVTNYPILYNAPSPINENQLWELFRVVRLLEKNVGVPLDVEWGFHNNELYIVQIRPIIGNFSKEKLLVESEELKNKKLKVIASSPVSIGKTSPDGFTGDVVLFDKDVSDDIIKEFEQLHGEEYIRCQFDVAARVKENTTAKILIDPVQCGRQVHSTVGLMPDLEEDEETAEQKFYAYSNGPVYKEALNGELIPHPDFDGIWVSKDMFTVFSDGLFAKLLKENVTGKKTGKIRLNAKKKALMAFISKMQEKPMLGAFYILEKTLFKSVRSKKFWEILKKIANAETEEQILKLYLENKKTFESIKNKISILEGALSNPLLPFEYENINMRVYRDLIRGINIQEKAVRKLKQRVKKKEKTPIDSASKFKVLIIDDEIDLFKKSINQMRKLLGPDIFEIIEANDYYEAESTMRNENIDGLVMDVNISARDDPGLKKFKKALQNFEEDNLGKGKSMPVIILSAFEEQRAKETLAFDYKFPLNLVDNAFYPDLTSAMDFAGKRFDENVIAKQLSKFRANKLSSISKKSKKRKIKIKKEEVFIISNEIYVKSSTLKNNLEEKSKLKTARVITSITELFDVLQSSSPSLIIINDKVNGDDNDLYNYLEIIMKETGKQLFPPFIVMSDNIQEFSSNEKFKPYHKGTVHKIFNFNEVMGIIDSLQDNGRKPSDRNSNEKVNIAV